VVLETGREPRAEELAERLAMPVEAVRKLMTVAGLPIRFEAGASA
jgi:DNA-directed RNA polymerase sigma subunit (sigma70/sigma32)